MAELFCACAILAAAGELHALSRASHIECIWENHVFRIATKARKNIGYLE